MIKKYKLNREQKLAYIQDYEEPDWIEDLIGMIPDIWEIEYDDTIINDFECSLLIDGEEYDEITKQFAEELLGEKL